MITPVRVNTISSIQSFVARLILRILNILIILSYDIIHLPHVKILGYVYKKLLNVISTLCGILLKT